MADSMEFKKLNQFTKGWLIGDFVPVLFRNKDVEVALKFYEKGQKEPSHYHLIAIEHTVIIKGSVKINGETYMDGDIITTNPGESIDFYPLTDLYTLVIKTPSVIGDKYLND
jgi:anti-sigma factor ChrR (cupin superfamily)